MVPKVKVEVVVVLLYMAQLLVLDKEVQDLYVLDML